MVGNTDERKIRALNKGGYCGLFVFTNGQDQNWQAHIRIKLVIHNTNFYHFIPGCMFRC
jgi:hypothetical protein